MSRTVAILWLCVVVPLAVGSWVWFALSFVSGRHEAVLDQMQDDRHLCDAIGGQFVRGRVNGDLAWWCVEPPRRER